MLRVKMYRVGNEYGKRNREKKGAFYKEFRNTSELAKFLTSCKFVYMVDPYQLSDAEYMSFFHKYLSLMYSRRNTCG